MKKSYFYFIPLLFLTTLTKGQTVTELTANATGNTYEDINAILAPNGGNVIEAPGITPTDCTNHDDFNNGETTNVNRHIQEVYDATLSKDVFKFSLHLNEDIDRDKCTTDDRQRNEIKTYAPSPDYLLGTLGETVEYKWKFKLADGFQASSSFTHLHQLKSVGGITAEESIPLITLTAYSSNGGHLVLRYSAEASQSTVSGTSIPLSSLRGNWAEVTETITYGFENEGSYQITITNFETGVILLNYNNATNRYYKTDADFIRPKWGIYRSLNNTDVLRDEEVLYADFSITEETNEILSNESITANDAIKIHPNPASNVVYFPFGTGEAYNYSIEITNTLGKVVKLEKLTENTLHISDIPSGIYFLKITNTNTNASTVKKLVKI